MHWAKAAASAFAPLITFHLRGSLLTLTWPSMATVMTHTVVALTAGRLYSRRSAPWSFWATAIVCSILPDADVLAFAFGIPYEAFRGHRGFTHSLLFAAILSAAVVLIFSTRLAAPPVRKTRLFAFFFALTASHGVIDAMTDGGLGIAFFSPFDTTRYFLPWRPIPVSPIGMGFFSDWGLEVLQAEIVHIWSICIIVWIAQYLLRRYHAAPF